MTRAIICGALIAGGAGTAEAQAVRPALDVVHYDFALTLPDAGASFHLRK